tara:strand:+ start:381 stop:1004 length:624 start_codon:yes stop_codon:yes gene_type:complete
MHSTDNKIINTLNYGFKKIYNIIHNHHQDESHIDHHKVVKNNGDVSVEDDGMFFNASNVPLTTIVGFSIYYGISKIIKYKHSKDEYIVVFTLLTIISYIYYLLWNLLHPTYHRYSGYGDNESLRNNFIYQYLEKYHMIHHLNKGTVKCNYNIILPGVDFLFGTYKGCIDNTEFCQNNTPKNKKEEELCEKQAKNIKIRSNIDYCKNR